MLGHWWDATSQFSACIVDIGTMPVFGNRKNEAQLCHKATPCWQAWLAAPNPQQLPGQRGGICAVLRGCCKPTVTGALLWRCLLYTFHMSERCHSMSALVWGRDVAPCAVHGRCTPPVAGAWA